MTDNVVALADYSVKIDGDSYGLLQVPDKTSKLVEREKLLILDGINLTELNNGLKRCAGLLYLAFNGVAGHGELRRDINKLQDDLVVQTGNTTLALSKFSRSTADILDTVKDVFNYLTEGSEEVAIEFLKQTGGVAEGMAKEALELAKGYEKLADDTMATSGKTQIAQSQTDADRENIKKQRADLLAKNAKAKSLSENLATSLKKLEGLYAQAKEKADQASERGFAVQMVGAILGPLAQGLGAIGGAFVAAKTGGLAGGGGTAVPPPAPQVDSAEQMAAKVEVEKKKKDEEAAKKDVTDAETAKATALTDKTTAAETTTKKDTAATLAKDEATKAPDDTKLKETAAKAQADAEKAKTNLAAADKALVEATKKLEEKKATLAAMGDAVKGAQRALETAAANLQATGAGLLDLAKSYEEEKRKYLDLILKYERQGIEALADMAEYAVRMSAVTDDESVKRTASESLLQAIKALNAVAQILRDAAKFWTSMKYACDALVAPKFLNTIQIFSKQSEAKRTAEWKKDGFKISGVTMMAKWQALNVILVESSQAIAETRKQVQANIVSSPSPEESLKLVPDLARQLSINAERAKASAETKLKALEKAA